MPRPPKASTQTRDYADPPRRSPGKKPTGIRPPRPSTPDGRHSPRIGIGLREVVLHTYTRPWMGSTVMQYSSLLPTAVPTAMVCGHLFGLLVDHRHEGGVEAICLVDQPSFGVDGVHEPRIAGRDVGHTHADVATAPFRLVLAVPGP